MSIPFWILTYIIKASFEILKQIKEKEKCSYKDLPCNTSISAKNTRLMQLENLKFITHHFDRGKEKRTEWYEITEKGIKFLSILEQLDQLNG